MALEEHILRKICTGCCTRTFVDGSDLQYVSDLVYVDSTIIYHLSPLYIQK